MRSFAAQKLSLLCEVLMVACRYVALGLRQKMQDLVSDYKAGLNIIHSKYTTLVR